jgi:two-component system nitrogen regulation response regulator NtrX
MFPTILIVDDEPSILQSFGGILTDEGFEVVTALNGYEALKIIETDAPDLVLLDIWMPGIDGIETLKEIKKEYPALQVVMITGHGTIETAVTATKLGAFDFIEKPLNIEKVIVTINNALNFRRLEEENRYLRKKMLEKNSISGDSPAMNAIKQQIAVVAPTDAEVLITGESGTGKGLIARTLHLLSPRAEQPLIHVNCAAIAEERIDSELFGHLKGAFPGAVARKTGQLELAHHGTLFLDKIDAINLKTQTKLLNVLQHHSFQPEGGGRTLKTDVRMIASTRKDLEKAVEKGEFREDLYFRLNVIPIEVPPLRDRKQDIPSLFECFLEESFQKYGGKRKTVEDNALHLLYHYDWPGNVRELKNLVERLAIMVDEARITAAHIRPPYNGGISSVPQADMNSLLRMDNIEKALQYFEQYFVSFKLREHHQDIEVTAEKLKMNPDALRDKLKSHL